MCVSKKKFVEMQDEYVTFKTTSRDNVSKVKDELKERDKQLSAYESATKTRNKELEIRSKHINGHPDLDILVESHTDNSSISTDGIKDNWDLSAKRATAITRLLQTRFGVQLDRILADGRSEYTPKEYTGTEPNKKSNRRIEITIMPKLDQFFQTLINGQVK